MKRRIPALWACLLLVLPVVRLAAAPEKAVCPVCRVHEGETEPEEVVATSAYKGKTYGFCSAKCKKTFDEYPEAYLPPVLPRPLPSFTVQSLKGEEVASRSLAGKPMLVDFWATWCQPCISAMPELQKLHQRHAAKGFSVVGISIDEGAEGGKKARQFAEKRKLVYPVYVDATKTPAWSVLHVRAIPAMFLVDGQGRIVQQWSGKIDIREVERAVEKLVSSKG